MVGNKVILIGRLTADVEMRQTNNGTSVASFTLAVNKPYNKENDHPEADFIDCVAWKTTAEFISKYFEKGSKFAVCGRLQTRTYEDKEGKKRKVTEVVVDEVDFVEKKSESSSDQSDQTKISKKSKATQVSVEVDEESDELPF